MEQILITILSLVVGGIIGGIISYFLFIKQKIFQSKYKLYEQFIEEIEKLLVTGNKQEFFKKLNIVNGKLFISASDKTLQVIWNTFEKLKKEGKAFDAKNGRPEIYFAIRKELYPRTAINSNILCFFTEQKNPKIQKNDTSD